MRERLLYQTFVRIASRITPARAGKTIQANQNSRHKRDHPRSCGKDPWWQEQDKPWQGSPPLVRERPRVRSAKICSSGITPARAGKTLYCGIVFSLFRDHPRSCGKDLLVSSLYRPVQGSPPLVRERRNGRATKSRTPRITPARAGKTAYGILSER